MPNKIGHSQPFPEEWENGERKINDQNPNQDCNIKEKLSAFYIEFLCHIYTFIIPKGFIVESFCCPIGEK